MIYYSVVAITHRGVYVGIDWIGDKTIQPKIAKKSDLAFTCKMKQELSDEQLILKYSKGDLSAFEILYERHKRALFRYCMRQFSSRAVAEECYQEIWMKLINNRVNYRPQAMFTTYLYRIAQNHVIDIYRKEKKRKADIEFDEETIREGFCSNGDGQIDKKAQVKLLRDAISLLPFEQKNTLLLKLDAGLSIEDISHILDCGKETVKSRLRYATNKLKGILKHPLEVPENE